MMPYFSSWFLINICSLSIKKKKSKGLFPYLAQIQVLLCFVRGMILRPIYIPMGVTQWRGKKYRKRKKKMHDCQSKSLSRSQQTRTQLERLAWKKSLDTSSIVTEGKAECFRYRSSWLGEIKDEKMRGYLSDCIYFAPWSMWQGHQWRTGWLLETWGER